MLTGDVHEADDLVFRAFEQAIRKIEDFRPTGSFYYWIYTILLNYHRMDLRKKSCRPEDLSEDVPPEPAAKTDAAFSEFLFRGSAEAVRSAVSHLPEDFREVIVLRYFEEMSTAEIAKVAGIPEGTVRSRLHYAKDALYAMLVDTELAPGFADRLVKATRPKWWLFRRGAVASITAALGFALLAGGAVALVATPGASGKGDSGATERKAAVPPSLWRVSGSTSLFTPEADDIDRSIEKGLGYLAKCQLENGSFPGGNGDTAAIPSLVGMAYLSKGYLPWDPRYGKTILNCLDYVLSVVDMKDGAKWRGYMGAAGNGRLYAHSIATLFLSEMSGMVDEFRQRKIDKALPAAVRVILDAQSMRKGNPTHIGGWRYTPDAGDSDLSCSGWALMALRSARLNGAKLPGDAIERAVLYIRRSRIGEDGFGYQVGNGSNMDSLTGAAILCLELCGRHLDEDSLKGARYLEKRFPNFNWSYPYYALYYTAQGLFQLGGPFWEKFSKWMYAEYMKKQGADGSWGGGPVGSNPYATAMTILAFTVPYRMLPIYQRDETVDDEKETDGSEFLKR